MKDTDNFEFGYFLEKTVDAYLNHMRKPNDTSSKLGKHYHLDHVNYFVPREQFELIELQMSRHTVARNPRVNRLVEHRLGSFLYMDIGRWGGSAPTRKETDSAWGRCRDFGLVCGRTALLCTYSGEKQGASSGYKSMTANIKEVSKGVRKTAGFNKMLPLLNLLSTASQLGPVTITKALACTDSAVEVPDWNTIHVFLGDIHAPIVKKVADTFGDAHFIDPLGDEIPKDEIKVPSWNRLDLSELKKSAAWAALTTLATAIGSGGIVKLPTLIAALREILKDARNDQFIKNTPEQTDPITFEEAEEWYHLYSGKDGKKGADIFEDADADLNEWIGLMQKYQQNHTPANPRLQFVQTGDLFDYWIGLKVGFEGSFDNLPYKNAVQSTIRTLFEKACFHNKGIERMFRYIDMYVDYDKSFNPVYLYGNHDNYLSCMQSMGYDIKRTFEAPGVRAEHGHYTDTFNHDEDPGLGWAITQLAYIFPSIRSLEDPASSWLSEAKGWYEEQFNVDVEGTKGPRLDAMEYAAYHCFFDQLRNGRKPLLAYVQGHSHRPMLKEIRIFEGRK